MDYNTALSYKDEIESSNSSYAIPTLRKNNLFLDKNFLPKDTTEKKENYLASTNTIDPEDSNKILSFPRKQYNCSVSRETKLQEWEGQVIEILEDDGVFLANLIDITANDEEEMEQGKFPLSDLSESDKILFEKGAVFRWIIGYKYFGATKERFSRIAFRNLPVWTEEELEMADKEAERLNGIEWD